VAAAGYVLSGAVTWCCLRKLQKTGEATKGVPKAALMTAAFFSASLIHIPLPIASIHLILNGLTGILLGIYAFPTILVGLFFQAVLFGHGGITTLGLNAAIMGLPALVAYACFRLGIRKEQIEHSAVKIGGLGFMATFIAISLSVLLFAVVAIGTVPADFAEATREKAFLVLALAHLPLMLGEGIITAVTVVFIHKVRPALLWGN